MVQGQRDPEALYCAICHQNSARKICILPLLWFLAYIHKTQGILQNPRRQRTGQGHSPSLWQLSAQQTACCSSVRSMAVLSGDTTRKVNAEIMLGHLVQSRLMLEISIKQDRFKDLWKEKK